MPTLFFPSNHSLREMVRGTRKWGYTCPYFQSVECRNVLIGRASCEIKEEARWSKKHCGERLFPCRLNTRSTPALWKYVDFSLSPLITCNNPPHCWFLTLILTSAIITSREWKNTGNKPLWWNALQCFVVSVKRLIKLACCPIQQTRCFKISDEALFLAFWLSAARPVSASQWWTRVTRRPKSTAGVMQLTDLCRLIFRGDMESQGVLKPNKCSLQISE